MSACPLVVLACESLHVCTVCIWRCEHARFCVEVFLCAIYKFSFIHSFKEMAGCRVLRSVSCFSAAISATESDTRGVVLPRYHTAVLHAASSLLYDVPSTVLVSRCDTANLRTSTLYDVPSTAVLRTSTLYDVPSIVLVSRCNAAVLRTSTLYDVPSIVLVSWCDAAVLRTSTLYDVPSTVLVS